MALTHILPDPVNKINAAGQADAGGTAGVGFSGIKTASVEPLIKTLAFNLSTFGLTADKFLNTGGSGGVNISNGTTDIFAATLSAANLDPSRPIKTNAVRELVSSNLDIADINNLQSELDNVISNPFPGTLKVGDLETDNFISY